ncbi:MAG: stage II sporulation protein M [Asticcacaulis sp.]
MSDTMGKPPVLQLKSQKFREAREKDWRELAALVDRAEKGQLKKFTTEELLNLPLLYRSAISSLSMAQSISLDRNMVGFLQALCARAYVSVYGPQTRLSELVTGAFVGLAQSVRKLWAEFWLAFVCFFLGALGGWLMCAFDQSWYTALVGHAAQGRDLMSTPEQLRETLGRGESDDWLAVFSVYLMSNNTQVALLAFAVGVMGGVPTALLLIMNGMMLGAMLWLFFERGVGVEFAAWLSIHGTTEILAIVLAGAAGFYLARRLLFPGHLTRMAALAQAGKVAGTVMLGVMALLVLAGLIEGFGRQMITDTVWRFAIGGAFLLLWTLYLLLAGRTGRKAV